MYYILVKSVVILSLISLLPLVSMAQTPIDALQQRNISYLEAQERVGYEFRSQIITEFDIDNASQHVNIQLSDEYSYLIVALGDTNIPKIRLDIKPTKHAKVDPMVVEAGSAAQAWRLAPSKSGRYKITINATDLGASEKGFVSFMVLRK